MYMNTILAAKYTHIYVYTYNTSQSVTQHIKGRKKCILRVPSLSLSTKNLRNRPCLLGSVNLLLLSPLSYSISAGQQKAPTKNKDWKSVASQEIAPLLIWTSP